MNFLRNMGVNDQPAGYVTEEDVERIRQAVESRYDNVHELRILLNGMIEREVRKATEPSNPNVTWD